VAGWSYPDWRGPFYPEHPGKGFSELRYAAERLDCLEINSTFYRTPSAKTSEAWLRQVDDVPNFSFTAKLVGEITHGPRGGDGPAEPREARHILRRFREGIAPLRDGGRLDAVLAQFPWHFEDGPRSREILSVIAEILGDLPLVAELRHVSFLRTGPDGALPFLERLGIGTANVDLPRSSTSPPLTTINTAPLGYFRLHGRNRQSWFDPQAHRDAKYDYLYSAQELREMAPAIQRVAERATTTYVIANNHFRGQAPANAFQLIRLLTDRPPQAPEALRSAFPFLTPGPGDPVDGPANTPSVPR